MAAELGIEFIEPELFPPYDDLSNQMMEDLKRAEKELRFQSQNREEDPKPIPKRKGWRQSRNQKREEK
jgi:hypothetical protein